MFNFLPFLKPFYRLIYNALSLFLLALWVLSLPEDSILYQVQGAGFYLLILTQVMALLLAIKSISGHGFSFLGIMQLKQFMSANKRPGYLDEPERGKLITSGLYSYMRHPLYTFSMVILVASPIMTQNLIYVIVCVGIYFWIGSFFEERNLVKRFGDDYRNYQKKVPRFIPYIFLFLKEN